MTIPGTITRVTGATALATCVLVPTAVVGSAPAQAAAYRYWTYWQSAPASGAWSFATQGPATSLPADGSVEGWAFGVTSDAASASDAPATLPDFAQLCGSTAATEGFKRIGLVVDTGPAGIAPEGEQPPDPVATCVVAPADASGYDVLRSVTSVRVENGLVCAVGDYPARECAPVLSDAEAAGLLAVRTDTSSVSPVAANPPDASDESSTLAADTDESGSGTPVATLLVVALVALGAGVLVVARRRREGGR